MPNITVRISAAAAILAASLAGFELRAGEDPVTIVRDYDSALDVLTRELIVRLEKSPQLLVWCFDESESMKDDQHEIKNRLARVYDELKSVEGLADDALLSVVTSYGAGFHVETRKPTSDPRKLREAIDSVPIDATGKELMCSAVSRAVTLGRKIAPAGERQIMLIMVTDEAGDPADRAAQLEPAIAAAKAGNCPVYFLGRQATFGYPFSYLRWRHPQTRRFYWIRCDQGPETAFVQVLQTDGFGSRRDSFASGFGPYAQMRLVRETQGVFLLLPSVETGLAGERHWPYTFEALRNYKPDWRSRQEVIADRDRRPLRSKLWRIINDLNPHDPERAKIVSLRRDFSPVLDELRRQVKTEGNRITAYLACLNAAEESLAGLQEQRAAEESARWQANYDLTRAQLVTYQARVHAYRACLDEFAENPKSAPPTREPNLRLDSWHITTVRANVDPASIKLADRAGPLLRAVIDNHPDTPWARLAEWELKRGFGVSLVPHYEPPYVKVRQPIPPPRL